MSIIFAIIGCLYAALILLLHIGNKKVADIKSASETRGKTPISAVKFSIVIPFRNEEKRLPNLLKSINELKFPKNCFEVLFINDDSSDASILLISETIHQDINCHILNNVRVSNSPKKDAITLAVSTAKYDWVITTDADCRLPKTWLEIYAAFIDTENPSLICAPVKYESNGDFLQSFQQLDALSLQWVAMGGFGWNTPIIANGANMAYRKTLFKTVNGFKGNDSIASGDDIFMLEKAQKHHPKGVRFIKSSNAIVTTTPENSWREVINQRVRWASKTSKVENSFSKGIGLLVFIANGLLLAGIIWTLVDFSALVPLMVYFGMKLALDAFVLYRSAIFFNSQLLCISVVKSAIVYPVVTVLVILKSITGNYSWKGRDF